MADSRFGEMIGISGGEFFSLLSSKHIMQTFSLGIELFTSNRALCPA
jgi:hypothetical protein